MRATDTHLMAPSHLTAPLCRKIFFVRVLARTRGNIWRSVRNVGQHRARRGKSGKSGFHRSAAPPQNGGRRPSDVPLPSAGQVPNVGRVRSGDRLLGAPVLLNAGRPVNAEQRIPQSRRRKRRRKRCRADRHHRKIQSPLTRDSRPLRVLSLLRPTRG